MNRRLIKLERREQMDHSHLAIERQPLNQQQKILKSNLMRVPHKPARQPNPLPNRNYLLRPFIMTELYCLESPLTKQRTQNTREVVVVRFTVRPPLHELLHVPTDLDIHRDLPWTLSHKSLVLPLDVLDAMDLMSGMQAAELRLEDRSQHAKVFERLQGKRVM